MLPKCCALFWLARTQASRRLLAFLVNSHLELLTMPRVSFHFRKKCFSCTDLFCPPKRSCLRCRHGSSVTYAWSSHNSWLLMPIAFTVSVGVFLHARYRKACRWCWSHMMLRSFWDEQQPVLKCAIAVMLARHKESCVCWQLLHVLELFSVHLKMKALLPQV